MGSLDRPRARGSKSRETEPTYEGLRARVDELEAMVEGLQDSVDREMRRQDERLDALARRLEPAELARVLSDDARKRGL